MKFMSYMDILKLKVVSEEARSESLEELSRELKIAEKGKNGVFRSGKEDDRESVTREFGNIMRGIVQAVTTQRNINAFSRDKGEQEEEEISFRGKTIPVDSEQDDLKAFALEILIEGIREEIDRTKNAEIMKPMSRDTGPKPNLTPKGATSQQLKERVEEQINTAIKQSGAKSEFDYEALEEQINNLLDVEDFLQYLEGPSTVYRKKIGMVVESATRVFELFGSLLKSGSDIDDILKSIEEALKEARKKADYLFSEDKFKQHPYDSGVLRQSIIAIQDYLQSKVASQVNYHTLTARTVKLLENLSEFVNSAWKQSAGKDFINLDYNLLGNSLSAQKNNFSFLKSLARNEKEHMYRHAPKGKDFMMTLADVDGKGKRYIKHRADRGESLTKKQEKQNKLYDKYNNLGIRIRKNLRDFNTDEELKDKFLEDLKSQGFKEKKIRNEAKYEFIHDDEKAIFRGPNGKVYEVGSVVDSEEYYDILEQYVSMDSLIEHIANQYKIDEGRILDVKVDRKLKGQLNQLKRKIDSMLSSGAEEGPDLEMNVPTTFKDIHGELKKPTKEE